MQELYKVELSHFEKEYKMQNRKEKICDYYWYIN
jgi:hypothetical protein